MRLLAWFLAALLAALASPPASRGGERSFTRPGPYPVGVRTVVFSDPSRKDPLSGEPRVLVTDVWYPAADEASGGPLTRFIDFFGARPDAGEAFVRHFGGTMDGVNSRFVTSAVRNAALRAGKYPLLIFSHGNGGLRHQNVFQLDHLASHGYVIASPEHAGNSGVTVAGERIIPYDRKGRSRSMLDRPRDAIFLIDKLLGESDGGGWLEGRLDAAAVGALGHSFGGYTVTKAAEMDRRIRAILPMTLAYAKPAEVPVLLMLGGLDRTVGDAGNLLGKAYFLSCRGPRHLLVIRRGGHFSFSDMDVINPAFGDGIGAETRDSRRIEYLATGLTKEIINGYTLAFFDCYLRRDPQAGEFLKRNERPDEVELRNE